MSRAAEEADRGFCARVLPRVSRTFALSIEALPEELREAVRVAYLLCRIVDTVEDGDGIALPDRMVLFRSFDELIGDDTPSPAAFERDCRAWMGDVVPEERELCEGAGAVFRRFRALPASQRRVIRPSVQEMSAGMQEYALRAGESGLRLATMRDLERYCYYVAGTVGKLLTGLFLQLVPDIDDGIRRGLEERAVGFGLGLQLVNIVKDVAADQARGGHCFLPQRLAERSGVEPGELLDPGQREAALEVVAAVCDRAREHLARAREYTELWPVPAGLAVREFCAVPLALALATLCEVERGRDTLRAGRVPKVSRETVAQVVVQARKAVASNEALGELFAEYQC